MELPKQAFIALAAVGWADGRLQRDEGAGLLHAARQCGLKGDELAEVERSIAQKVTLDDFDSAPLSPWNQVLIYALASWLAQLDGVVSTSEHTTLTALGEKLGLSAPLRVRATAAAFDISCLPEGGRPDRYDFEKLAARLRERLPQIESGRPAPTSET